MDLHLDGKKAFLLASSKGLGRATAQEFVREGMTVAISSSSEENLREAKDLILTETGAHEDAVIPITCDLSDPESVAPRIQEGVDRLGGLDVLVTNSGGPPKINFEEATIDQFDETYVRLVKSVLVAIDAALPHLKESEGVITNIIATSTQEPETDHILGNTIRPSIYGLSKALANEYAPVGIRVNCVTPRKVGPTHRTKTARSAHIQRYADEHGLSYEDAQEEYVAQIIPLGRYGDPADFGRIMAVVSSDVASHVTGSVIDVDGGWTNSVF